MSITFNSVVVAGHLTENPSLSYSPAGEAVCRFPVAVPRVGEGGTIDVFEIVALGSIAEAAAGLLQIGTGVLISGRLLQDHWDSDEGIERSKIGIVAGSIQSLAAGAHREELS